MEKLSDQVQILDALGKGMYASQIAKVYNFSQKIVHTIVKRLRHMGYIHRAKGDLPKIPKIYEITEKGRFYLNNLNFSTIGQIGHSSEKQIENQIIEHKTRPKKAKKISIHKLRFKQKLLKKPSWLYQNITNYPGLSKKKIKMNNWNKFILYFNNYNDFGGIHNIEVCNNYIIYNFRRVKEDSFVTTSKGLRNFLEERVQDCKKAGTFLGTKGFELHPEDPVSAQKHHFVIETEDGYQLKDIGKYLELHIKNGTSTMMFDDSLKEGGEMEVDTQQDAETILDEANNIQEIRDDVDEIKANVQNLTNQISELVSAIGTLVKAIGPQQTSSSITKQPPGGLYR